MTALRFALDVIFLFFVGVSTYVHVPDSGNITRYLYSLITPSKSGCVVQLSVGFKNRNLRLH